MQAGLSTLRRILTERGGFAPENLTDEALATAFAPVADDLFRVSFTYSGAYRLRNLLVRAEDLKPDVRSRFETVVYTKLKAALSDAAPETEAAKAPAVDGEPAVEAPEPEAVETPEPEPNAGPVEAEPEEAAPAGSDATEDPPETEPVPEPEAAVETTPEPEPVSEPEPEPEPEPEQESEPEEASPAAEAAQTASEPAAVEETPEPEPKPPRKPAGGFFADDFKPRKKDWFDRFIEFIANLLYR